MCCIGAPQVWAGPGAVVGIITTRLMDPLPVQVTPEINVELTYTAVLLRVSVKRLHNNSVVSHQMYCRNGAHHIFLAICMGYQLQYVSAYIAAYIWDIKCLSTKIIITSYSYKQFHRKLHKLASD